MSNAPKNQMDYEELEQRIEAEIEATVYNLTKTVQSVVSTVEKSVHQAWNDKTTPPNNGRYKYAPFDYTRFPGAQKSNVKTAQQRQEEIKKQRAKKRKLIDYAKKAKSERSNISSYVLVAAILCCVTIFAEGTIVPAVVGAFFLAGAVGSFYKSRLWQRATVYANVLGNRTYCTIKEIAIASGETEQEVCKDLQKNITNGKLEGWYIAPDGSRLFANLTAYQLYLSQLHNGSASQEQPKAQPAQQEVAENTVLAECKAFTTALHLQNEMIENEEVSQQLDKIEKCMYRITVWLEKHPGKEDRVRRFTNYYLPTIMKLLQTYHDVDLHAEDQSEVAIKIQQDIVRILKSIIGAFTTLENVLMEDTALDVSAEVSAMETMLAQDGLAKSDF